MYINYKIFYISLFVKKLAFRFFLFLCLPSNVNLTNTLYLRFIQKMVYNDCYKLDFSVFDIIDAALSFRIFSRCPAMELRTDGAQYFIAYVTSTKEVFFNHTSQFFIVSSNSNAPIRIDKLMYRDVN